MRVRLLTAAGLATLVVLTGCGSDTDGSGGDDTGPDGPAGAGALAEQAEALLACTEEQGLAGTSSEIVDGIVAVDLTTRDQTIVVHLLPPGLDATAYEASLDKALVVDNAAVLGGAISDDNLAVIEGCLG